MTFSRIIRLFLCFNTTTTNTITTLYNALTFHWCSISCLMLAFFIFLFIKYWSILRRRLHSSLHTFCPFKHTNLPTHWTAMVKHWSNVALQLAWQFGSIFGCCCCFAFWLFVGWGRLCTKVAEAARSVTVMKIVVKRSVK